MAYPFKGLEPNAQLLTHPQEIKFAKWLYKRSVNIEVATEEIYRIVEGATARFYLKTPTAIIPIFLDYDVFLALTREFFGYRVEPITLEQLEIKFLEEIARRLYAEWGYRQLLNKGLKHPNWIELTFDEKEAFFEEAKEYLQMPFDY